MNPGLVQRQAGLAAAALLATLGVLALGKRGEEPTPAAPSPPAIRWASAVVGIVSTRDAKMWSCGAAVDSGTIGIAHPTLPCGVDLVVARNGKAIRTEVVARSPVARGGPEFELTGALAEELGLKGEGTIQWRFAG